MAAVLTARDHYLSLFEARAPRLAGPRWLEPLRRTAIAHFAAAGFPTVRDEDWRYTSLGPLGEIPFEPPAAETGADLPGEAVERLRVGGKDWPCLVFVDGRHAPRHSAPTGAPAMAAAVPAGGDRAAPAASPAAAPGQAVTLASLTEAMRSEAALVERHLGRHATWERNVFAALNTAFVEDGAFVHLPADTAVPAPIELVFVTTTPRVLAQPRVLVVAEPGSRVTIVERYVGLTAEPCFSNVVSELHLGRGAAVDHYVLQEQGSGTFHFATVHAELERDSALSAYAATFGARLARATLVVGLRGEGARADLGGLYVLGGRQHADHHVTVDHAVPRGTSRQLYKGVLDGASRAVFNGRIVVRRDAQKTDASQTNKHLLLSDGVEVDSKPQLEIFADDVKCTHGAAEGQLAPEALFYLRSRGLAEPAARALLTYGFAREVLDRIGLAPIRAALDHALTTRLEEGSDPAPAATNDGDHHAK